MIPLNLSSLISHRQLLNRYDSCPPTTADDRTRCRPNAAAATGEGGRGRTRRRVRFADDEMGEKLNRKRREHQREGSNRKRQRTEADENKRENTMDTQLSNFEWSESSHHLRSTTNPMMTTTTPTSVKSDDYDDDDKEENLSSLRLSATDHGRKQFPSIQIPHDPRLWSRLDVYNWLEHMKSLEFDLGDLDTARFLMNGKALCLMTPAMFIYRVPHGGRILYKDFQTRLSRAVADVHHKKCISV